MFGAFLKHRLLVNADPAAQYLKIGLTDKIQSNLTCFYAVKSPRAGCSWPQSDLE